MVVPQPNLTSQPSGGRSNDDEFVRLFVQNQRALFIFLRTLLNDEADAEEVLQETSMILWHKRDQFVIGTSFAKWAMTVAQYEVFKFRRSHKHDPQALDQDLLNQLATEMADGYDLFEARHRALGHCIESLNDHDRHLVRTAYAVNSTKKVVGQQFGMTANCFYKALNRIRHRLQKCIQHRLVAEGFV